MTNDPNTPRNGDSKADLGPVKNPREGNALGPEGGSQEQDNDQQDGQQRDEGLATPDAAEMRLMQMNQTEQQPNAPVPDEGGSGWGIKALGVLAALIVIGLIVVIF